MFLVIVRALYFSWLPIPKPEPEPGDPHYPRYPSRQGPSGSGPITSHNAFMSHIRVFKPVLHSRFYHFDNSTSSVLVSHYLLLYSALASHMALELQYIHTPVQEYQRKKPPARHGGRYHG